MNHAEKESIIWASGQYLTLHLPQDYDTWEEEKLYNHLVEFVWEPFECFSGEQVWKLIKELARTKEEA
tara:strand:- start:413 stop:616 length:204 start_codon:yes stop_codon:yes gene_type:complete